MPDPNPNVPEPVGLDWPAPDANPRLHVSPQLMADIAAYFGLDREAAAEKINDALRVHGAALAAGWRDATLPAPTRTQHMAELAVITDQVAAEGGPLGSPTVFAVLRDVADTEPLVGPVGDITLNLHRCGGCGATAQITQPAGQRDPFPHLISCPWLQATKIVGIAADDGPRLYPDVELSTDDGRTWSPFPLAPMAGQIVSDGQVHDDGRGHLYRAVGSAREQQLVCRRCGDGMTFDLAGAAVHVSETDDDHAPVIEGAEADG